MLTRQQQRFCERNLKIGMLLKSVPSLMGKGQKEAIDLQLSANEKPIEAKWVTELYDHLKGKPGVIKNGFEEVEILKD